MEGQLCFESCGDITLQTLVLDSTSAKYHDEFRYIDQTSRSFRERFLAASSESQTILPRPHLCVDVYPRMNCSVDNANIPTPMMKVHCGLLQSAVPLSNSVGSNRMS